MSAPEVTGLPRLLGMTDLHTEPSRAVAAMTVTGDHLAPIGRLHAAAAITLADTLAGYGCLASLPAGAHGFATSTITSHHLASAEVDDVLHAVAELHHGGRSTQIWDVYITRASDDRAVASLRCLQQLLYPR